MGGKRHLTVPVAYTRYRLKPRRKMKPLGLCNFDKKTISVNKALKEMGSWSTTFWHEWLHAVAHEGGYHKIANNEAYTEYMTSAIMRMLTDEVGSTIIKKQLARIKQRK